MNKKIQIIGEHHVNMDDERGSGRFCSEMLTLANLYFFVAIPVLFTNNFGISALVAEFFQKRVQTPLSDMSNMGLISI
ncbi:MAG: hypothetical protein KME46_00485 [Brasilonema angustatum HA4187-MV1]|nr:hypothetical protein [Brasilonema angustatum HA4187-MV1]